MISEDHVTLKPGVMMLKKYSFESYIFYNIFKAKAAILNSKNIHNIIAFAVFWVK